MSSSKTNANLITVTIEFLDGRKEEVTLSKIKSVTTLIEKAVELKEGAVSGLMKNGVTVSPREMIKFVPLISGDTVKEAPEQATSLRNLPSASFKNTILRSKVKSGKMPATDVLELLVVYRDDVTGGLSSVPILVRKTATINELKETISQLIRRPVKELGSERQQGYLTLFGWSNLDNESRSYNHSVTLDNLGITDKMTIEEYDLPILPSKNNTSSSRQAEPTPTIVLSECDTLLIKYGIHDKKSLRAFALQYHPDKSPYLPDSKEYNEVQEVFKLVYGCAEKKNYQGGVRKTRRSKSRRKHRKQKTRKY